MIAEIRTTIYDHLLTVTGLSASNLWWGEAPQGTTEDPYCVISLVSNPLTRDTNQEFEEIYFQVSTYGTTLNTIEVIEANVHSVLYNSLTALNILLTNYIATQISLQFRTNLKIDEKFWQNVLRYKLRIK